MSRHHFEVATQKKTLLVVTKKLMSRLGRNAERTYKVLTRQFKVATTI